MKNMEFPKKQLLILVAVCSAVLVLAVVIGLMARGSNTTPIYEIEEEQVIR